MVQPAGAAGPVCHRRLASQDLPRAISEPSQKQQEVIELLRSPLERIRFAARSAKNYIGEGDGAGAAAFFFAAFLAAFLAGAAFLATFLAAAFLATFLTGAAFLATFLATFFAAAFFLATCLPPSRDVSDRRGRWLTGSCRRR